MRLRLAIVALAALAAPVHAADDIYNIMKPEPGAAFRDIGAVAGAEI